MSEDKELRGQIARAIFDPGNSGEGYKGERTLTEWQTDAVLSVLELETKPAAFEVLDHVNGTYVTTNEQAALATEFPYNGLYRRVGALEP